MDEKDMTQEKRIPVYVTPIMKRALELGAAKDGRSVGNFLQFYAWQRAQQLGVTLEEAKELLAKGDDVDAN